MRVFFFSAHKILVKTELPRLRSLGYEVFRPAYRTLHADHQSATSEWERDQPTTLPAEVFRKLGDYDFFYQPIVPEIADLLNRYFDAVVITSEPGWVVEVLRVFRKKVIFRAYGQVVSLSDHFWYALNAFRLIVEKDDFWFAPHAREAVLEEHSWLREREVIVPYVPSDDALGIRDTYRLDEPHDREIMLACPNLANPFYREHYEYLKRHFAEPHYRYYGVQMVPVADPQVMGTLPRQEYFTRFRKVAGFLYTYRDPKVCFLPPIEMMVARGPVVFLSGSLLDRLHHGDAPGRAETEADARRLCERLMVGDTALAADIVRSQRRIIETYMPEHVWPIFDATFRRLLGPGSSNHGRRTVASFVAPSHGAQGSAPAVCVLAHIGHNPITLREERYETPDPGLNALRVAVDAVRDRTSHDVVITCLKDHLPFWYGFFGAAASPRIRFLCTDQDLPREPISAYESQSSARRLLRRGVRYARKVVRRLRCEPVRAPALRRAIERDGSCVAVLTADPAFLGVACELGKPLVYLGRGGAVPPEPGMRVVDPVGCTARELADRLVAAIA